jgi:hypothetical protein
MTAVDDINAGLARLTELCNEHAALTEKIPALIAEAEGTPEHSPEWMVVLAVVEKCEAISAYIRSAPPELLSRFPLPQEPPLH